MPRLWQYPGLVEPLETGGGAPPETITADKWLGSYPAAVNKVKKQPHTYPAFFVDDSHLGDGPAVESITPDKWTGKYPAYINRLKRQQYSYPDLSPIDAAQLTTPERVDMLKWKPQYPDKIYDRKRMQHVYPAAPTFVPATTVVISSESCTAYTAPTVSINAYFTTPDNAFVTDDLYAVSPDALDRQQYGTFGFSIPSNAVITQLNIKTEGHANVSNASPFNVGASYNAGTNWIGTTSNFNLGADQFFTIDIVTLGFHTWVPSDFTNANFRVRLGQGNGADTLSFDQITVQVCYYLSDTSWNETTTPDKWYSEPIQIPNAKWGKLFSRPSLYPYLNFDPNPVPEPPETITSDKWTPRYPDKVFDIKRKQYSYPNLFIDNVSLTQTEAVTVDRWIGNKPDKIFDRKRAQWNYPNLFIDPFHLLDAEVITLDKWVGYHPDKIFGLKRMQQRFPYWFGIEQRSPNQVMVESYMPQYPDKVFGIKRQQYTYPSFTPIDTFQFSQGENITVDKWFRETARPRFDIKHQQATYPTWFTDMAHIGDAIFVALYWQPRYPDKIFDIKREQYSYPNFMPIDASAMTQAETITMDKWFKETEKPLFDIARNQFTYPSFVSNLTESTFAAEQLTLDKWLGYHPDKIFDLKRLQFTYPNLFIDAKHLLDVETLTIDKWAPQKPDKIFSLKRQQHTYPFFWTDLRGSKTGSDMGAAWIPQYPAKIFDRKRLQYNYPWLFYYDGLIIIPCPPFTEWDPENPLLTAWAAANPNLTAWAAADPNTTAWASENPSSTSWTESNPNVTEWEESC